MLAGMMGDGPAFQQSESMFETFGKAPSFGPTPEAMEQKMKQMMHPQKVVLREVHVKTFDLGIAPQVEEYRKVLKELMAGVPLRTHAVMAKPPLQFVNDALGGARYIAHLEWCEFELVEKGVQNTPAAPAAGRTVTIGG